MLRYLLTVMLLIVFCCECCSGEYTRVDQDKIKRASDREEGKAGEKRAKRGAQYKKRAIPKKSGSCRAWRKGLCRRRWYNGK